MDGEAAVRLVNRIVRQFDAGAGALVFDPTRDGATTFITHRGFEVEIGVGRCEQGAIDLMVGVSLGRLPAKQREAFLVQLLQWNHCTAGIGHFSLDDDQTVYMVSRHGLDDLDAEGLSAIIAAMTTAARGALEAMSLAELSAGLVVE
jgi:hypothetical protein